MLDPGLQGAEDSGLVIHQEQTAEPTVFPQKSMGGTNPTSSIPVQVQLDWAYADERRLAFQLTVFGLVVPPGSSVEDVICRPRITTGGVVTVGQAGGKSTFQILDDQPGKPIELTYVYHQNINAEILKLLDLNLDLIIGPCAPGMNFLETNRTPPPPFPLIGNYHLAFQVPVSEGKTIRVGQETRVSGYTLRLESVTLTPSYIEARVCLPRATGESQEWVVSEAYLQGGQGMSVQNARFSDAVDPEVPGQACYDFGFEVPGDPTPVNMVLTINSLASLPDGSTMQTIRGPWVFSVPLVKN